MASANGPATGRVRRRREPVLKLPIDQLNVIIVKAREYDAKGCDSDPCDSDPQDGSNPTDDEQVHLLAAEENDPVREELLSAIRALNEDERIRLVALAWLGRGTFDLDEWKEALSMARSQHSRRTAEYLLTLPLLGDYLEDGLVKFDECIFNQGGKHEGPAEYEPPENRCAMPGASKSN